MKDGISKMLKEKFGNEIVDKILYDGEIDFNNFDYDERLIICEKEIKSYVQKEIINIEAYKVVENTPNNNWGFDFPGWLGKISKGKEIMIIGQEPNIQSFPIQVVYGFSNTSSKKLYDDGKLATLNKKPKSGHLKIWYRLSELLKDNSLNEIEILENCYITDLCHFAPSKSGTEKTINKRLKGHQKWKDIRNEIVKINLRKEVEAISPKIIICQSNIAYNLLLKEFSVKTIDEIQMPYPKKGYKIRFSKANEMNIIGIPHIGSNFNITNKFWDNYLYKVKELLINKQIIKEKN